MQIAIYARVSTKDKGQDTDNQLIDLRRLAGKLDYEIVCEYVEEVSGSGKVIRPMFNKMLEDARHRKFDLLLFWSLDRVTREGALATLKYLEQLTQWGVGWKSYTEQYLDSTGPFREAVIAILACIAKQERIKLGERVKVGMATAKSKGVKLGRKLITDTGRKWKGKKAPTVSINEVFKLKDEGKSLRQIASIVGVSKDSVSKVLSTKGQLGNAA